MPPIPLPRPHRRPCLYPQSHATSSPIAEMLDELAANSASCSSFYLDTIEIMSKGGEDHAQGLARTHLLSNKQIYWFQSNSFIEGGNGTISCYQYHDAVDGEHVAQTTTSTLAVAPMEQLVWTAGEPHPSDIVFLPDVNGKDAGYLFVTEEYKLYQVAVYYWQLGQPLVPHSVINPPFLKGPGGKGPNFIFIDRVDDTYYLGAASNQWGSGFGYLFKAQCSDLFPDCGLMDTSAFKLAQAGDLVSKAQDGHFDLPVGNSDSPSQVKLIRDSLNDWYLLAFRGDPEDSENATDYIDAYQVSMEPFGIFSTPTTWHVVFPPGRTSFASTGTHYVDERGRLLVSSSYRWAQDYFPGGIGFVSRVDELPSSS
jgi:hypothetical protein